MNFLHEDDRIYIQDGDTLIGEVRFSFAKDNSVIVIEHTFVNPKYRGQGIASDLVYEVVKLAREKDMLIQPVCTFARAEFLRKADYADVYYKPTV